MTKMIALYQNNSIREFENQLFKSNVATPWHLMEQAGLGAFKSVTSQWPMAKRYTVVCGKGNNAGDGFVVAALAHEAGHDVTVIIPDRQKYNGCAEKSFLKCAALKIKLLNLSEVTEIDADVIVDALLGTGLCGELKGMFEHAVDLMNAANCPVLSIDIPSGLNADNGSIMGCAVEADFTHTLIGLKTGLYTNKGPAYAGHIVLDKLSLPEDLLASLPPDAKLLDDLLISDALPKRVKDAHKGNFGHVLVIGGDYGMGGAVRMTAEAALRVGAGLVTVATRPEHVAVVSSARPEIMCHHVSEEADILPLLERASVIIIGPGLGTGEWSQLLLKAVLKYEKPTVADADCLNLLADCSVLRNNWILTPHPGEAARLLKKSVSAIQCDRFKSACELTECYGGVAVLKGVGTIVCQSGQVPAVCPAGNPGMATGGMGDVLSGIIGGLLGQKLTLFTAAKLGVYLHAKAADLAATSGGERGLLPTDLMLYLRDLVNQ